MTFSGIKEKLQIVPGSEKSFMFVLLTLGLRIRVRKTQKDFSMVKYFGLCSWFFGNGNLEIKKKLTTEPFSYCVPIGKLLTLC